MTDAERIADLERRVKLLEQSVWYQPGIPRGYAPVPRFPNHETDQALLDRLYRSASVGKLVKDMEP